MKATRINHKNETRIKVDFTFDAVVAIKLKQIPDSRWSNTLKAWHIPYTKQAFSQLLLLFPELEYDRKKSETKNEENIETGEKVDPTPGKVIGKSAGVSIVVIGRRIAIKLPKNNTDTRFITSLKFSRWDAKQYQWIVPNYPGNIDLLKDYFKDRITDLIIKDEIDIYTNTTSFRKIGKNDLLLIKTNTGRLNLYFGYNKALTKLIKTMPYYKWNTKNKSWSIPFAENYLKEIKELALVERLNFLYEEETEKKGKSRLPIINKENFRRCPDEYILKLKEMRYSNSTLKTYKNSFEEFINFYTKIELNKIDEVMITEYMRYLVIDRKVSSSYQNTAINAIKFYYEKVLKGVRKVYYIDRPRKEKALPVVLNEEEVISLFKVTENIKHKAILMLAYSAGLRLGELINIKIKDIDSSRMQVRIEQGKGKKDRYSLLSTKLLEILRTYFSEYKPKEWLFEGAAGGQYSARSIQLVMADAVKKAGIQKKVSVHTLRHCFATHLLENGTDIRYIQSLLGHESSKTTEVYTHITTKGFGQIKSPMDKLDIS